MKNWKKAIALVASAAALVSVAACGSSNAGGSSDSGKKTVGFVAVGPEGGFRTANVSGALHQHCLLSHAAAGHADVELVTRQYRPFE